MYYFRLFTLFVLLITGVISNMEHEHATILRRLGPNSSGTFGLPKLGAEQDFLRMVRGIQNISPGEVFTRVGLAIELTDSGDYQVKENRGGLAVHREGKWQFLMPDRGERSVLKAGDWVQIDEMAFQLAESLIKKHLEISSLGVEGNKKLRTFEGPDSYISREQQVAARVSEIGSAQARVIELSSNSDANSTVLGRSGSGDFTNRKVSNAHMTVKLLPDNCIQVTDLSRNGTEVLGSDGMWGSLVQGEPEAFPNGQIFRLGGSEGEVVKVLFKGRALPTA